MALSKRWGVRGLRRFTTSLMWRKAMKVMVMMMMMMMMMTKFRWLPFSYNGQHILLRVRKLEVHTSTKFGFRKKCPKVISTYVWSAGGFKCKGIGHAFHILPLFDLRAVAWWISQTVWPISFKFPSHTVQIALCPMHQRPPYQTCRLTSDLLAETDDNSSRSLFRRTDQESPKFQQIWKSIQNLVHVFRLGFGSAEVNFGVQTRRWVAVQKWVRRHQEIETYYFYIDVYIYIYRNKQINE